MKINNSQAVFSATQKSYEGLIFDLVLSYWDHKSKDRNRCQCQCQIFWTQNLMCIPVSIHSCAEIMLLDSNHDFTLGLKISSVHRRIMQASILHDRVSGKERKIIFKPKIVKYVLNFSWHNFKANLVQPCLVVSFFFCCKLWMVLKAWEYFLLTWRKNVPGPCTSWKRIFPFSTGLTPNRYMIFPIRL